MDKLFLFWKLNAIMRMVDLCHCEKFHQIIEKKVIPISVRIMLNINVPDFNFLYERNNQDN